MRISDWSSDVCSSDLLSSMSAWRSPLGRCGRYSMADQHTLGKMMISAAEYAGYDALGLAELLQRGELTTAELLETAIGCAQKLNPQLNAVVRPMHELARKRAAAPLAGPFAGVPFLAKDLCQDYDGVPTSYGTRARQDEQFAPTEHAEMLARWLRAGVVVFGRTKIGRAH